MVARIGAAALAIGLPTAAPAAVDGGKADDIPVRPGGFGVLSHGNEEGLSARPAGGDRGPGAEWDLSSLVGRTVAADPVLATTPHTVTVRRSTGGEVALGRVSIPSPKLRFRYHVLSAWRFSPYAGAAIGARKVFLDGGTTGPGRGVAGREEDSDPWVLGVGFGFLFRPGRRIAEQAGRTPPLHRTAGAGVSVSPGPRRAPRR